MAESFITRIQWNIHINIYTINVIYNYFSYTYANRRGCCKTVLKSVQQSKVTKVSACLRSWHMLRMEGQGFLSLWIVIILLKVHSQIFSCCQAILGMPRPPKIPCVGILWAVLSAECILAHIIKTKALDNIRYHAKWNKHKFFIKLLALSIWMRKYLWCFQNCNRHVELTMSVNLWLYD